MFGFKPNAQTLETNAHTVTESDYFTLKGVEFTVNGGNPLGTVIRLTGVYGKKTQEIEFAGQPKTLFDEWHSVELLAMPLSEIQARLQEAVAEQVLDPGEVASLFEALSATHDQLVHLAQTLLTALQATGVVTIPEIKARVTPK